MRAGQCAVQQGARRSRRARAVPTRLPERRLPVAHPWRPGKALRALLARSRPSITPLLPPPLLLPSVPSQDPLTASEEELIRAACERHHPGLNRAFLEAGTPWSNVSCHAQPNQGVSVEWPPSAALWVLGSSSLPGARVKQHQLRGAGRPRVALPAVLALALLVTVCPPRRLLQGAISGSPDAVRRALRSQGHERLMRVVHALTSERQRPAVRCWCKSPQIVRGASGGAGLGVSESGWPSMTAACHIRKASCAKQPSGALGSSAAIGPALRRPTQPRFSDATPILPPPPPPRLPFCASLQPAGS